MSKDFTIPKLRNLLGDYYERFLDCFTLMKEKSEMMHCNKCKYEGRVLNISDNVYVLVCRDYDDELTHEPIKLTQDDLNGLHICLADENKMASKILSGKINDFSTHHHIYDNGKDAVILFLQEYIESDFTFLHDMVKLSKKLKKFTIYCHPKNKDEIENNCPHGVTVIDYGITDD